MLDSERKKSAGFAFL